MPSRLSSLLVRDGLVGVKRMEKAFQRQVIYGGSLDTILLEMNLVPEDRLVQYLALASGLPPAARDEGAALDPDAVGLISRELAEQHHAVPVALEGDAVRVLVCSPLEISELEDLADRLDRALQPLITPEFRWHLVFAAAYGLDPPARFTQLARMLDGDPSTPAVGRARSVIIAREVAAPAAAPAPMPLPAPAAEDEDEDGGADFGEDTFVEPLAPAPAAAEAEPAVMPPRLPAMPPADADTELTVMPPRLPAVPMDADTLRLPGASRRPAPEDLSRARRRTMVGLVPNPARTDVLPVVRLTPASLSAEAPAHEGTAREAAPARAAGGRTAPRPPSAPIATEGRDTPLSVVQARELLATAEDRDTVFLTLLRAARARASWAGLLTVQGGVAIGRVAVAEPGLDARSITTVLIPLDAVSPFRNAVSSHQPHVGPLTSGDPGIDAMVTRMGGTLPPAGLILPIVLRDRVVALIVAHRAEGDLRLADVTELLPLATATSDALGRLIVKHKAAARPPSVPPGNEFEDETAVTKRMTRVGPPAEPAAPEEDAATAPTAPIAQLAQLAPAPADVSIDAEPPASIDDVLAVIETSKEGSPHAEAALAEAAERAAEAVAALDRRFPGKLRVDRFAVSGRALRPAQYGGLLELIVRLGPAAADLVVRKLAAPQRDVRFYAAVCVIDLRPRNAVPVLAERLFDQDYGVRACALEALSGYPPPELEQAFTRARTALDSPDPEVVGAATAAIVALGDVDAIEELIDVVGRGGRGAEHARKALLALTAQDFGTSERKWRKWWDGARKRHRIEWLIEGLGHKDDAIRETAIHDLRRLTGEYFGYHHDLPRREREAAADRWAAWWRETGQRRFVSGESERHRPTAKLPIRDD